FTFKVARFYCNATGNLHGGASSMIFDLCTSLPVMALGKKDFWLNAGVSRTLIVNYLRPAPEGMELELEAEVISLGKNLAYTRGLLKRAEDGVIVATCEHTKAAV
ncbi:HotDog domain-containing protein, partial [Neohortaea acidophila]